MVFLGGIMTLSCIVCFAVGSIIPDEWSSAVLRGDMIIAYPEEDNNFDPGLMPSIANGFAGATIGIDALYMAGVYVNEVEWVEAGCLQLPSLGNNESIINFEKLAKILNPQGRYELSGICKRFDELIQANNSKLDIVEHGFSSRRARLPYSHAVTISIDHMQQGSNSNNKSSATALDMANAMVYRRQQFDDIISQQKWYTHRDTRSILVMEITISRNDTSSSTSRLHLHYDELRGLPEDVVFEEPVDGSTFGIVNKSICKQGYISRPDTPDAENVLVATCEHIVPKLLNVRENIETFVYLISVHSSLECNQTISLCDPIQDAASDLIYGEKELLSIETNHISAWIAVRQIGWIEIEGEEEGVSPMALSVNTSMYDLLSTLRADWHYPGSPGSLATPGYWGVVAWDSETFIVPAVQVFHPNIVESALQYRMERMPAAKDYAIENGYEGCMFPWQSASSGHETDLAIFANTPEQHISGDIALLLAKHFYQTGDVEWLDYKGGGEIASCIAEFWASRVVAHGDDDGSYSIQGVIPPDEFAIGTPAYSGVSDNPWTNLVAADSLKFASYAQNLLDQSPPSSWNDIASNLRILLNDTTGVHPEYDGFDTSKCENYKVKQADVTLIAYPGDLANQTTESILADLACYEKSYDPNGPAMTYAISTINYLEANQLEEAEKWLSTTLQNQQAPYQVWTETVDPSYHPSDMGSYHFLTAAGGFIQAIVNGYGGIRIREDGLRIRPRLLSNSSKLSLHGVSFQGRRVDITREVNKLEISLISGDDGLQVRDDVNGNLFDLPFTFEIDVDEILGSWTIIKPLD